MTAGALDQIKDWVATDTIGFGAAPATAAIDGVDYLETTAGDFTAAKAIADAQIAGGAINYVVVQVGPDVVVFADVGGTNTTSDAITLVGKTLADIAAGNIFH